jgi:hypothetical protein
MRLGEPRVRRTTRFCALGLAAGMLLPGAAFAGNGNTLYLLQENTYPGAAANNIDIDQSAGAYTTVGSGSAPAIQRGAGNQANLTLSGDCAVSFPDCGTVSLYQDNSSDTLLRATPPVPLAGPPQGNVANVSVSGTGDASIVQVGDQNVADMVLDDGHGLISQQGLNNIAKLEIQGDLTGSIAQTGNANIGDLLISGAPGSSVSLTQVGNNQSYVGGGSGNSVAPMTVFTTAGAVTISQTSF